MPAFELCTAQRRPVFWYRCPWWVFMHLLNVRTPVNTNAFSWEVTSDVSLCRKKVEVVRSLIPF